MLSPLRSSSSPLMFPGTDFLGFLPGTGGTDSENAGGFGGSYFPKCLSPGRLFCSSLEKMKVFSRCSL